jgi:hypothetical protein
MSMTDRDITFFDCNAFIGGAQTGTWKPAWTGPEMLRAMDEAGISKSLVWHVGQQDWCIQEANTLLSDNVRGAERLWGCWTVLPPQTGETPAGDELFRRMKADGIRSLRIFPGDHNYVPGRTALGGVLDGLVERRIPLLISLLRSGMNYAAVDRLLLDFPGLVCVLCDVGVWGVDRYIRPLLERFPEVRAETSLLALHDGVLDSLVRKYGAGRFLFGTGFPDRLPASAMLPLLHADMGAEEKRWIASGNLTELMGGVRL